MITPERESEIYREIDTMGVSLERSAQCGWEYYADKLLEVRRHLDRVSTLLVEVHRELGGLKSAARAATALRKLQASTDLQVCADLERVKGLYSALSVRKQNLRQVSIDIRFLLKMAQEEAALGEVQPPVGADQRIDEFYTWEETHGSEGSPVDVGRGVAGSRPDRGDR